MFADACFALCWIADSLLTEHVMTSKKHPETHRAETPTPAESEDSRLDEALEESFPASDPIAVDTGDPHHAEEKGAPSEGKKRH